MAKSDEPTSQRDAAAAEADDSESDDDFWAQWQRTSIADVKRDTYGTERRRTLEKHLR